MNIKSHLTKQKFTLVEMLVVLTIIMVLVSFLLPALKKTIYTSKKSVCAMNMKNQALGLFSYADDNYDFYPRSSVGWRYGGGTGYQTEMRLGEIGGRSSSEVRREIRPYWGITSYIEEYG
jgi:hypothetical protein